MEGSTLVVACSDTHSGSTLALCPPDVSMDDGGHYGASKAQLWLWSKWHDMWDRTEKALARFDRWVLVLNGDLVDGDHHNTPQILSRHPGVQFDVAQQVFRVPLSLKPASVIVVRGTEAHVGPSAATETALAKWMDGEGVPVLPCPDTGAMTHWHARCEIDGVLMTFAHHGRTGFRNWTRPNASNLLAADIALDYLKSKEEPPAIALRSHFHKWGDSGDNQPVRVIQLPAWQLTTAFGHRVATESIADIGGLMLGVADGEVTAKKIKYQAARSTICRV